MIFRTTLIAVIAAIATPAFAQYGTDGLDWPYYGGDAGSTKYSPPTQIDAASLYDLGVKWTWDSPDNTSASGRTKGPFEVTPLAIDGKLYVVTALNRVVRIDGVTGTTDWTYDPVIIGESADLTNPHHRGVAYWTDGVKKRVIYGTEDEELTSLNADTGLLDPSFGTGGIVDLAVGIPRITTTRQVGSSSPPIIYQNVIVIGNAIQDSSLTDSEPPGYIRGYNVETGALIWTFKTVPDSTSPDSSGVSQAGTWLGPNGVGTSWDDRGHTNAWAPLSLDVETGIVYLPTGCSTGNFSGTKRAGNNVYASSLLALNALTGQYVWHFQTVHHDIWDFDNPCAPNLLDITVDRGLGAGPELIKAVAQITKQGHTYVFDRLTGEPVWPIPETAVPTSPVNTITGNTEQPSPTQPVPSKPPAFSQQGVTLNDLNDVTANTKTQAKALIEGWGVPLPISLFQPPYSDAVKGSQPLMPINGGTANWPGAAVDPATGMLYVNSVGKVLSRVNAASNLATSQAQFQTLDGASRRLFKGSYNDITAIDLNTGTFAWQVPNGYTANPISGGPDLPGIPGGFSFSMLMGDLLFYGNRGTTTTTFRKIVVLNKNTGATLREITLSQGLSGNPMTYRGSDGYQYVAFAMGTAGTSTTHQIVALRLLTTPVVVSQFTVD